ncbi:DNA ligase 1 [Tanacetum coccineum]
MISSSSRERSAFDALMSNARAAAAYKKSKPPPTSSFSSKKRKTITLNSKQERVWIQEVEENWSLLQSELGTAQGCQDKKKNHIKGLLVSATDCEPQYMIRLLQTKLRIGLAEQTLLTSLGHAIFYTESTSPQQHRFAS